MPSKKNEENKKKSVKKRSRTTKVKPKPTDAKPSQYFVLVTGTPIKNLKEFVGLLENMNDWVFRHHVNYERNDFSNWIDEILNEKELADELRKTDSLIETQLRTMRYMINKYI